MAREPPTYWDYLKLDRLLGLQGGLEDDEQQLMPDELHFIVVHQAFELWFKLSLRELRLARDHLAAPRVPEERIPYVVHHLRRVSTIFELLVEQFRVMETLTPQDFLAFRDKLVPASGFQSFQLRQIEIIIGLEDAQRIAQAGADPIEQIQRLADSPAGRAAWQAIEQSRNELTLRAALHEWLYRTPIQGSQPGDDDDAAVVDGFLSDYLAALGSVHHQKVGQLVDARVASQADVEARIEQAQTRAREFLLAEDVAATERARMRRIRAGVLFIESYRELPLLAWPRLLVDTLVEVEENLVLWRSRHARMVERIIGRRIGTGGSSGVDYLDRTATYRVFTELWAVRTILLPKHALPQLKNRDAYGFA